MSEWPMRGQFRHLHFKTFPMTPRTPQCEVFWPFNSSSEFSWVPEDSKFPLLGVWASPSHLAQSGVATICVQNLWKIYFSSYNVCKVIKCQSCGFHHLLIYDKKLDSNDKKILKWRKFEKILVGQTRGWVQAKVDHFLCHTTSFCTVSWINMSLACHKIIIMPNFPLN
jgi:hypothetical protein